MIIYVVPCSYDMQTRFMQTYLYCIFFCNTLKYTTWNDPISWFAVRLNHINGHQIWVNYMTLDLSHGNKSQLLNVQTYFVSMYNPNLIMLYVCNKVGYSQSGQSKLQPFKRHWGLNAETWSLKPRAWLVVKSYST